MIYRVFGHIRVSKGQKGNNEPKSGSYRILVLTGLFISIFERAHERTKNLNEALSGS